jgi:signal transduction histidine kinase
VLFPPKFPWQRYLAIGRALLAASSLSAVFLYLDKPPGVLYAVSIGFLLYSAVLALTGRAHSGAAGLLALFADTLFLLTVAAFGTERILWLVSIFFLFLLVEALALYGPVEVAVVAAAGAIFCAALPNQAVRPVLRTVIVAGALACGFAVYKRRAAAETVALRQQLDAARVAAEKARDSERHRIASDFHDGPLQSFISLQMRLEILRKLLDRDFTAGMEDLRQLRDLAQSQVRDLRAFLNSMRPVDVDGANLVATARRTAEMFQKESGIPVTFMGAGPPVGLPPEMSMEVLQMLREALHNVQKHAGATRVAVAMEKTERSLEISIDDNGHGFNFAGAYSLEELEMLRLGPASLKRRARSLNADLLLESRPGRGAGLRFRIPLQ